MESIVSQLSYHRPVAVTVYGAISMALTGLLFLFVFILLFRDWRDAFVARALVAQQSAVPPRPPFPHVHQLPELGPPAAQPMGRDRMDGRKQRLDRRPRHRGR